MTTFGVALSSEEHDARRLVEIATHAADLGFSKFSISDHFHPWNDEQGESPMVWPVIGAIAAAVPGSSITTAVTCPTFRTHPLIIAQAAATAQDLTEGRFALGVGSGENLNEHVLGQRWPEVEIRHAMLREAVAVIRRMWQGGNQSWHGDHYTVENARIFTLPEAAPPIYVSGFGPRAIALAAEVGDGYVNTSPEVRAVADYRTQGGVGPAVATPKCCWGPDEARCRATVHRLWPNSGLPGQLAQELATPMLFEQASELVTEEQSVGKVPCGPDPQAHIESMQAYVDAGYDEIYVQQVGPDQQGCYAFYREQVLPHLGADVHLT